jgi:hypothetical protein
MKERLQAPGYPIRNIILARAYTVSAVIPLGYFARRQCAIIVLVVATTEIQR